VGAAHRKGAEMEERYQPSGRPYRQRRWVRCVECLGKDIVRVSRHRRLRSLTSACCGARMHPLNWSGFK